MFKPKPSSIIYKKNKMMQMKYLLIFMIVLIFTGCSKNTEKINQEVPFFGTIERDVKYANNVGYDGNMTDLKLDIYTPTPDFADRNGNYPLYLHVHGGAYIKGTKESAEDILKRMANKGYLAVAIDYRIGWNHSDEDPDICNGDSTELKMAIYRAIQDYNASLRFLVANSQKFKVDTNRIFTGGSSAGAGTVLNAMVITDELAQLIEPDIYALYGSIERSGNSLTNSYKIKGQGAMWGGLGNLDFITTENAVPTSFFHGLEDQIAPYGEGYAYSCDQMPETNGSGALYPKFESLNIKAVLHSALNQGHDPGIYDNQFLADNLDCFFSEILDGNAQSDQLQNREYNCK